MAPISVCLGQIPAWRDGWDRVKTQIIDKSMKYGSLIECVDRTERVWGLPNEVQPSSEISLVDVRFVRYSDLAAPPRTTMQKPVRVSRLVTGMSQVD